MTDKSVYLRGLNGVRTIAAIGVLLSHINLSLPLFNVTNLSLFGFDDTHSPRAYRLGEQSVTMFFILSGFLITYLLSLEINRTGRINIKGFYFRRILRIWPLYYLYILIVIVILLIDSSSITNLGMLPYYIFLLSNIPYILKATIPALYHLWSIGVEEQFYAYWPLLFRSANFKKIKMLLMFLIILQISIRLGALYFFPNSIFTLACSINRFDCMMLGGLVALLYFQKSEIIEFLNHKIVQSISWIILILLIFNIFHLFSSSLDFFAIEFVTISIIVGQIIGTNKIVNLENKFMATVGKYSFGIYIYHPIIILLLSRSHILQKINNEYLRFSAVFIFVVLLTYFCSSLSYNSIEKRILKYKDKFSVKYN